MTPMLRGVWRRAFCGSGVTPASSRATTVTVGCSTLVATDDLRFRFIGRNSLELQQYIYVYTHVDIIMNPRRVSIYGARSASPLSALANSRERWSEPLDPAVSTCA